MKKKYILIFFLIFLFCGGCRPGGGGGVGSPVISIDGGAIPHYQELIIDEKSIIVDRITDKSCRIYWKTNVPATSCVEYGRSVNYDKTTAEDKNMVLEHFVELYSLQPRTRHYFRVISSDAFNHLAQSVKELYFDTGDQNFPPSAVTLNEAASITSRSLSLSWSQSYDDDFLRYELYRDTTASVSFMSPKITTITAKMQTAFNDTNLTPNTVYYYILYVLDTAELAAASNVICATTSVEYNALTKINFKTPVSVTTDSMTLTWERCNEADFASYRIYRSDKPGVDTLSTLEVEITDSSSTSVEIKNLTENTNYYFKIYLKNKGTVFTASDEALFRTCKNGELKKTINGVYYGNDIKVAGNKAYVSAYDSLYVIDLLTHAVSSLDIYGQNDRLRFAESSAVSQNPKLYIVNRSLKEIIVFDTSIDAIVKRLPAGSSPVDTAVDETGGVYYTIDFHEGRVNKFDLTTGDALVSKYIAPMLTSIVKGTNNSDVFISRQLVDSTGEVFLMPSSLASIKMKAVTGKQPVYLYMDRGGQAVYCANYRDKSVTRIDAAGNVMGSFATGSMPHSITQTRDGKYTFIANFESGDITMFDNAQNSVSETFANGKTPRAIDISADGRELYVIDYESHSLNIYAIKK